MQRHNHAVLQRPIAIGFAAGGGSFDIHMRQAEAMEKDHRVDGVKYPAFAVGSAAESLQVADAGARLHRRVYGFGDYLGARVEGPRRALRLAVDDPGFAAVPSVKLPRAMVIEHDMAAGFNRPIIHAGGEHQGAIPAARMAPDHRPQVADEATQIKHMTGANAVHFAPGDARRPFRDSAGDGGLVKSRHVF